MATKRRKQVKEEEGMATTPETAEKFAGLSSEQLIEMYRQWY